MGKAGKWIKNLLLGKREEKFKKIDIFYPENNTETSFDTKVKRRWSFRKPVGGSARITSKVAVNKFSTSFDSGDLAKLQIQALLETHSPRCLQTALTKACEDIEVRIAAATKIQAAFRSYLARRALHALRGLVKIQALVRGHLVRKQATATMRGMHALMAIQVRARIHRIQVAEEANLLGKQPPQHREFPHFKGRVTEENKDSKDMHLKYRFEPLKSRSGPLDCSQVKSRKYDSMTFYSKHLSVLKRENQYKQKTLLTAPNSPVNNRRMSDFNPTTMDLSTPPHHIVPHRQSWSPSFMNNTESSKAKSRSQSEPRQRPKQGTKHQIKFAESPLNGPRQNLFSKSLRYDHGNLDHWVINLHGSMKDSKRDSFGSSTVTSDSYY